MTRAVRRVVRRVLARVFWRIVAVLTGWLVGGENSQVYSRESVVVVKSHE